MNKFDEILWKLRPYVNRIFQVFVGIATIVAFYNLYISYNEDKFPGIFIIFLAAIGSWFLADIIPDLKDKNEK